MNGEKKISYEDYKNLSKDEQNLYQFTAFSVLHDIPSKYAKKWVEKVIITVMSTAGIIVISAIVGSVVIAGG